MDSISPVLTENEVQAEQVLELGSEIYFPIIICRVTYTDKNGEPEFVSSLTRFRFTDAERDLIANGADLILGQPHHGAMMPVSLELAMPGEYPVRG